MTLQVYNEIINRVKDYPIGTGVAIINTRKNNNAIMGSILNDISHCGVDITKVESTNEIKIKNLKEAEKHLNLQGNFGTPIAYAILLITPKNNVYSKLIYNNLD